MYYFSVHSYLPMLKFSQNNYDNKRCLLYDFVYCFIQTERLGNETGGISCYVRQPLWYRRPREESTPRGKEMVSLPEG